MVFGLFARKLDPSSNTQLHTPSTSPSISHTEPPSSSPQPNSHSPEPEPEPQPEVTDPTALYDLIRSVPPQTLHAYALAHLRPTSIPPPPPPPPSPCTLTALTKFFCDLSPPPQLHCVRCHASFFDLSNTDTSCRVPHDDDSALIDRSAYETVWSCCGGSVEGTGDMGPPDGWCYEGRHTTDIKRARFRADSSIHDDKLVPCSSMGCHGRKRKRSVSVSSSISTRKKANPKVVDASSPKSAASTSPTRKPTSKASTPKPISKPTPTPKPLSRTGTSTSSASFAQPRNRPLPKSNLHQSHVASPTLDGNSESESDPRDADIPSRPTRERTKVRPTTDDNMCKPRTRSAAREERSLSRTRASVRGGSMRLLRERNKEKGMSESDGDERGRGRGREMKKRRVGV
ncbi:uncharacterized protein EDB91DRAFT_217716 [Suillus paluster]|uniref:uncharacterized protein n=1 Tax=Suillus paluster TaxID=48578 RepID=UPI001B85B850|nr:uncharacterized protein EDB91DRAFT_217716 [Suillus paluster]KAG1743606.1 hypothetical protein EDB91DRAFT_217716 [Suillus paluster]